MIQILIIPGIGNWLLLVNTEVDIVINSIMYQMYNATVIKILR